MDLGWPPLFAAAHAAVWLRRLPAVLDIAADARTSAAGPQQHVAGNHHEM